MAAYNEEAMKVLKSTNVKKKPIKKRHPFRNFLIFTGLVAMIIYGMGTSYFNIKNVVAEGNSYYTDRQIITMSDAKTGVNIFWGAGDSKIKNRLKKDPYFRDVSIKRRLPDTLVIKVEERRQIAAVEYGDKYVVIDTEGVVLRTGKIDPKLTLIAGLKITKMEKGEKLEVEQKNTLSKTLKMLSAMEKGDLFFKKAIVEEDEDNRINAYILDSLVVKGKPQIVLERMKSGDLQKVVNKLMQKGDIRGTVAVDDNNFITFSPDI